MTDPRSKRRLAFPIVNLEQARFECVFGRGCDGICCRNGRPPVYRDEADRIDANLDKILPALRPEARANVEKRGYLSRRSKAGQPSLRVSAGWCVFFNRGCVLHQIGAAEGDKHRYKPAVCALFPITKDRHDRWKVRQKDFDGEIWDLACLNPETSKVPAAISLRDEIARAQRLSRQEQRRGKQSTR
jgi:Fe-S-cluster containining protein